MRIDFKPIRMTRQKPTLIREAYIDLRDTHLYYSVDFDAEIAQEDDAMPWVEERTYNICSLLKRDVAGVDIYMSQEGKHYKVSVLTLSPNVECPGLYFSLKDHQKAIDAFNHINNWILDRLA